jgi:hypothetical protein
VTDLEQAVEVAILAERQRLMPRLLWLRIIVPGLMLVGMLVLGARGDPLARASTRGLSLWLGACAVVAILPRFVPHVLLWMRWAQVVVDLPLIFLAFDEVARVPNQQAAAIPLWYLAAAGVLMVSSAFSMSRLLVWVAAATATLFMFLLSFRVGLQGGYWGVFMVLSMFCFAFLSVKLIERTERLALHFAREQRETATLNEELKRQLADRAGQLASAIARLSSAPRAIEAGSVIEDRYRVMKQLGAGGMGAVYEVERISDGNRLALKVLMGVADREALARFAREAQIAAQLHHPNIVSIVDVDVAKSGMLFLVMELAVSSLEKQREQFGDRRFALPILKQIAEGLSAMHSRGIIHRDLKPANVLLVGDRAKLADFGIASLMPDGNDSTISVGLTRTGAFMGTPLYMAPELEKGARAATPASDVFALGIVAYELLAGRAPFAQPPVLAKTQDRPEILDGELGALIDRCLNFDPSERPTAEEVSRRL